MDHNIPRPKFCLEDQLDSTKNQMHAAISNKDLKTALKLMDLYNIQPHEECSVKGYYWTALHYACHFGSKKILKHFCRYIHQKYPADFVDIINVTTKEGWTPLMISAIYNKPDCTKVLLKAGGQRLKAKDKDQRTASDLARYYGWKDLATKIDEKLYEVVKDDSATPINALFLSKATKNGTGATTTGATSSTAESGDGDIESLDHFYDLLKNGTRLPCLICQLETGWIQYTKCCGQPLHYWCIEGKLKDCPNCKTSGVNLINEVLYPERAFSVEN